MQLALRQYRKEQAEKAKQAEVKPKSKSKQTTKKQGE